MNPRRVLALVRRIVRQIALDRRTVALVILAPILMLSLGAILFRAKPAPIPLGIVDGDEGVTLPAAGTVVLGERIAAELAAGDTFRLVPLALGEIDARLRDGTVQAVVVLPTDFSAGLLRGQDHHASLDLKLEGSDPTRSRLIAAAVSQAGMKGIAALMSGGLSAAALAAAGSQPAALPISINTTYLYGSQSFETLDYVGPMYIAFLSFFFVFVLTCVAFLRERSQGTMERLLATPATRLEIILGYLGGLGLFALLQVAIILSFTVWVLKIHYLGNLALLFLVVGLLALVGVGLGILASTFARNEFQVIQFIPIVIIPQALLCGMVWPIKDLPAYLRPFSYIMPLTYANRALSDVMLKGQGLAAIGPSLLILVALGVVIIALGAVAVRREVA
jgi:ABC-2 type transport system permease protein